MTMREFRVLVAQRDPQVTGRIEAELQGTSVRVAGPVGDLEHATRRAEVEMVAAVVLDLFLQDGVGPEAFARFHARHPGLPVVVTAPRRSEPEARRAVTQGARLYLLDEEIGRGLLLPVLLHVAMSAGPVEPFGGDAETAPRRLLHDMGNLLAAANGESELLLDRAPPGHPLAEQVRGLNAALAESVRLFRKFAAARRAE
jgi:CheY-like chemotaxis protein